MRRVQLFEFTDQAWYPQVFRSIQTDYLQFVTTRGQGHQNLVPLLARALKHAKTLQFVDLCSGSGGPWGNLIHQLEQAGFLVDVILTDKYPHPEATWRCEQLDHPRIHYLAEPVDARHVPDNLHGMRTLFEGFHHFEPEDARLILRDALEQRATIGIFEASLPAPQGPLIFMLSPLMTLLGYLFSTPFIQPRTLARFLWTYIPIVPLTTSWDGIVSFLRVYTQDQLERLVEPLQHPGYRWEIGRISTGTPLFEFTYLLGYPL
jgi:hypothetical protein